MKRKLKKQVRAKGDSNIHSEDSATPVNNMQITKDNSQYKISKVFGKGSD